MLKIALVSEHASPLVHLGGVDSGGQNVYVAHVARQLASRGHAVDVFTRRHNALLPEIYRWRDNLRVIHVPAGPPQQVPKEQLLPHMPAFAQYLQGFLRRARRPYDLVHANFFMSGLAALPATRELGIPLVMTFHALGRVRREHQGEADGFPDERFALEEQLLQRAERTVAECPRDKQDMLHHYHADPRRIDIVPCGFDPGELAPVDRARARAQLGWPQDAFIVLQLGRLVPRKGIDNVIRGVARATHDHGVPARLYVVGGNSARPNEEATPEIARLRAVAAAEGVGERVEFTGRRDREQLALHYSAADVFVTTPWYEPFGITPLEAMACATPVIGSSVGGIAYSVVDGETGFLVPPHDPAALGARLAELHAAPALRRAMGQAGLRRVRATFTWSRVARSLEQVYRRTLRQPLPAARGAMHG